MIGTDEDVLASSSTGNGATWSAPTVVNSDAGTIDHTFVSGVSESIGPNSFVAVWLADGFVSDASADVYTATTLDGGATWTAGTILSTGTTSDIDDSHTALYPTLASDSLGNVVAVWPSVNSLGGTVGTDQDLHIRSSTDGGATWPTTGLLRPDGDTDDSVDRLPAVAIDDAGNGVAVFIGNRGLGGATGTDSDIFSTSFILTPTTSSFVYPRDAVATSEWSGPGGRVHALRDGGLLSRTGPLVDWEQAPTVNAPYSWHAGPNDAGLPGGLGNPPLVSDQEVVFDLGRLRDLRGVHVWNHNQMSRTHRGIDDFEILASSDSDPLTATFSSLGSFNLSEAGGGLEKPQHIPLSASGARLVKFDIQTAHSAALFDYVGLSEVVFETSCTVHRWSFDEPAGAAVPGTAAPDVECGDDGTIEGAGAVYTGTGIDLPGGAGASGAGYVDLPNGLLARLDSVTFEAWFTIDGATAWARLFDFGTSNGAEIPPGPGGSGTDYVMHTVSRSGDINLQRTEIRSGGMAPIETSVASTLGTLTHVAVTLEGDTPAPGDTRMTLYRDGDQVGQLVTNVLSLADVDDRNAWLGRSNFAGDSYLDGTIEEFRLYEEALPPIAVKYSFLVGHDIDTVVVPEPGFGIGLMVGAGMLVSRRRSTRRGEARNNRRPA